MAAAPFAIDEGRVAHAHQSAPGPPLALRQRGNLMLRPPHLRLEAATRQTP